MTIGSYVDLATEGVSPYMWGGVYVSEKLDGMRCWWDTGLSRGYARGVVGWANRLKGDLSRRASGFWTRYGGVITPHPAWVEKIEQVICEYNKEHGLQSCCLDGELMYGDGSVAARQELFSIVKQHVPDRRWDGVSWRIYDAVPVEYILGRRTVAVSGGGKVSIEPTIAGVGVTLPKWVGGRAYKDRLEHIPDQLRHLQRFAGTAREQEELVKSWLPTVKEGLITRGVGDLWAGKRSKRIVKIKNVEEVEGVVVGTTEGEGRLEGMIGALVIDACVGIPGTWNGHRIVRTTVGTGLTDEDRRRKDWVGRKVMVEYRGISADGRLMEPRIKPSDASIDAD